jgi:hypothetical protein
LVGRGPKCFNRCPEFAAEQLWKVLGSLVKEYCFMLGQEYPSTVTNCTNKVIREMGNVFIEQ